MSVTPPPGYGVYTRTANPNGGTRSAVCTFGFRNVISGTAASVLNLINVSLSSSNRPFNNALNNDDWTQTEHYLLLNVGGVLTSAGASFSIVGTVTQESPPAGTSVVVHKRTVLAGRQYRGRVAMYPSCVQESDVSAAGIIDPSSLSGLQTQWDNAFAAANSAGVPFYLIHGPDKLGATPAPTPLSGFNVDALVGSQRRRLRR